MPKQRCERVEATSVVALILALANAKLVQDVGGAQSPDVAKLQETVGPPGMGADWRPGRRAMLLDCIEQGLKEGLSADARASLTRTCDQASERVNAQVGHVVQMNESIPDQISEPTRRQLRQLIWQHGNCAPLWELHGPYHGSFAGFVIWNIARPGATLASNQGRDRR